MANVVNDKKKRTYIWVCAYCGIEFEGGYTQRYCSGSHKTMAYRERLNRRKIGVPYILKKDANTRQEIFSKKMRYEILERDNFKCVACGRGPKDGVILNVDHIFLKSKGGKATLENGRTLCDDCNRGKSDLILDSRKDDVYLFSNRLVS